jgi:hypothetical protein
MSQRIATTALLVLFLGCGTGSPREDLFGPAIPAADIVAETLFSGIEDPVRAVIRTEAEWQPFREALGQNAARPIRNVDFSREMIIVAGMGTQRQGGRSITFGGIQRVINEIIAEVHTLFPDSNCETPEITTTPLSAVAVRRSDVPVRFVEESVSLPGCP